MQRPIMDPTFLAGERVVSEDGAPQPSALALIGGAIALVVRALFSHPIRLRRRASIFDDEPVASKVGRGLMGRIVFLPAFTTFIVAVLVAARTHPLPPQAAGDPGSLGLYFESRSFESDDGTSLQGWLVPAIDAKRVLMEKERLLRRRRPAVVIAHDFGRSQADALSLLGPLHDEGFVTLTVGLRGVGAGWPAGQTLGINESRDIAAAVGLLRDRPFVDPDRIAIIGLGTGANASLIAAGRDSRIAALALVDPTPDGRSAVAQRIGPNHWATRWMQPLCTWAFEIGYRVDVTEIDTSRYPRLASAPTTLTLHGGLDADGAPSAVSIEHIRAFFKASLRSDPVRRPQPIATAN